MVCESSSSSTSRISPHLPAATELLLPQKHFEIYSQALFSLLFIPHSLFQRNLQIIYKPTNSCTNRAINHIYKSHHLLFPGLWARAEPWEQLPSPPHLHVLRRRQLCSAPATGLFPKHPERIPASVLPHCALPIQLQHNHTKDGFLCTKSNQGSRMFLAIFLKERGCPSNNP